MKINIPAFHNMEYIYGFIINEIIQNLKRATIAGKTNKQIFVIMRRLPFVKPAIIFSSVKSPPNISFGKSVSESCFIKLNDNIHKVNIA